MLSVLAVRYPGQALAQAHPGHWLVWEPGAWHAPKKEATTMVSTAARRLSPVGGEALALALELRRGQTSVVLGRAEDCDLAINDGTLSSRHLAFTFRGASWELRDVGSRNGTRVDGVRLFPGQSLVLRSGMRIEAADVLLTYLSPEGMAARLQQLLQAVR